LSGKLRRIAPNLRAIGYVVEFWRKDNENRDRMITLIAPKTKEDVAPGDESIDQIPPEITTEVSSEMQTPLLPGIESMDIEGSGSSAYQE